jgi:hypothetical protein
LSIGEDLEERDRHHCDWRRLKSRSQSKNPRPGQGLPFPAEFEAATGALAGTIFPAVGSKTSLPEKSQESSEHQIIISPIPRFAGGVDF